MSKKVRWDVSVFSPRPTVSARPSEKAPADREFDVKESRVWLGRWQDDELVVEACRLRRISQSGALVLLENHLPEGKSVWVSLHGQGERFGSVPARVSRTTLVAPGAVLVWLTFGIPCPDDLLYAAVFGPDALEASLN